MNWQPIETVPRDGRCVMLLSTISNLCQVMFWDVENKRWTGYVFLPLGKCTIWWDEAVEKPTHWAPLPTAP